MKRTIPLFTILCMTFTGWAQTILFDKTAAEIKAQCPKCIWEVKNIEDHGDRSLTTRLALPDSAHMLTICYNFYSDEKVNSSVIYLFDNKDAFWDVMDSLYNDPEVYTFPNLSQWEGIVGSVPYTAFYLQEKYGLGFTFVPREIIEPRTRD